MTVKTHWGELIREIRVEQGLSQRQLAEISGVNRNVLRLIEAGGHSIKANVVERLLEVLGYELEALKVAKLEPPHTEA